MKLPNTLPRREALTRALVAVGLTQGPLALHPAWAAQYTIVPSGSVAEKAQRMNEVGSQLSKARAKGPDQFIDPYLEGEMAQLEYDIGQLKKNAAYAKELTQDLQAGKTAFPTSLRVPVPDMAEALRFWQRGAGALVLSTALDATGANVTRIGYGSQSLMKEDGAKFALELVQSKTKANYDPEASVLQYVQLALPVFRLSQAMANGGDIISSYGWTEVVAPGGLTLRVRIDETRRDPFEFIALRTADIELTTAHYTSLGMTAVDKFQGGKKFALGGNARPSPPLCSFPWGGVGLAKSLNCHRIAAAGSWGVRQVSEVGAFDIDREPGTVQMNYVRRGDPSTAMQSTGLLLLPSKKRGEKPASKGSTTTLTMVGSLPAGSAPASPDGVRNDYLAFDDFEKSVGGVVAKAAKSVMDDGFDGILARDVKQ